MSTGTISPSDHSGIGAPGDLFAGEQFHTLLGDCIESMRVMPDCSVDAVVTDPPYGIRFMGKAWDGADIDKLVAMRRSFKSQDATAGPNGGYKSIAAEAGKYDLTATAMRAFQEFSEVWAREAFRVLKPGGHLLSFASPRTYHRMTSGIEDAGFEIRDQAMWIYSTGFPKSHNLDGDFEGWGTALKPAHEPICVARKPLDGTVAANMAEYATGAINIDACRVPITSADDEREFGYNHNGCNRSTVPAGGKLGLHDGGWKVRKGNVLVPEGRWPANLTHDGSDAVVALFPASTGQQGAVTGEEPSSKLNAVYNNLGGRPASTPRGDTGSAARYFYCAKASRADRNEGCESLEQKIGGMVSNTSGQHITRRDAEYQPQPQGNNHPTVKPTDLMRYLCRLVTAPGGIVLDPFMGSGTTGKAAILEGFRFIGCELDPDYMAIAEARLAHAQQQREEETAQGVLFNEGAA